MMLVLRKSNNFRYNWIFVIPASFTSSDLVDIEIVRLCHHNFGMC